MNLLTTILLALGMSVDAFAAALARGAGSLHYTWRQTVKTALIFGIVETITPLIGWLAGSMTQKFIAEYDHWLAFGLLLALGLKMIWGALHDDGDEAAAADGNRTDATLTLTIITAIATSIDSMVVGVGLAFLDANIWLTALAIGTSPVLASQKLRFLCAGCFFPSFCLSRTTMNPLITDYPLSTARTPVIVALDFANEHDTLAFVRRLSPELCQLKIGKELFTATGRSLVEKLIHQGFKLFLDLKYHDIPNTVAQACKVAADMGVWLVDMHASGGRRMMEAAADAVANYRQRPQLIGVTVLTSMEQGDLRELGFTQTPEELVLAWAALTKDSGLDGVVCSAHEAQALRQSLGNEFLLVTPGIRLDVAGNNDDQRRIMTPQQALAAGSSYLVMGRPITQAADPVAVLQQINHGVL